MRKGGVCVVVGLILLLAACGEDGGRRSSDALRISTATVGARTARFETTISVTHSSAATTVAGVVDFDRNVGSSTVQDGHQTVSETRWVGSTTYERTDSGPTALGLPAGSWIMWDFAQMKRASRCEQVTQAASSLLFGGPSVLGGDPDDILEQLLRHDASLERMGSDTVRGVDVTHWRVMFPEASESNCGSSAARTLDSRVEIWVDAQDRLRRARVTSTAVFDPGMSASFGEDTSGTTAAPTKITWVVTTDLFDFGTPVEVSAPPRGDVFDQTSLFVAFLRGNGTVDKTGWREAAHGTTNDTPWTIWYATTTTGWRCYDAEGIPPPAVSASLDLVAVDGRPNDPPPEHDGRRADCNPAASALAGPLTTFLAGPDGNRWVLVARSDDNIATVRLRFGDGTTTNVPVEPETGLVQWTGPASKPPKTAQVGVRTCAFETEQLGSCPSFNSPAP